METTSNNSPRVFDEREFTRQLRPAWTPLNIALMVFLFVVGLWPLGLAAIVYMSYGREMGIDLSNWGKAKRSGSHLMSSVKRSAQPKSGNAAFDDWRDQEMTRLDEERRKLDEARAEFEEYVSELRKARDREEFESFQRRRNSTIDGTPDEGTTAA
ncbi:DUF2852 domain-containing protein [Parvularcula dongshanensis]|nr:DUF2852 domain-containing protein [Parvularcula dongshanensis]